MIDHQPREGADKLGPLRLMPGVGRMNALSFFPVAMLNVSVFVFMNFMQPYVLEVHLGVAPDIQGTLVGSLGVMQEIIIISLTALMGALADKYGRQPIFSIGLIIMALAYFLFPLVQDPYQLYIVRAIFAVGVASASTILLVYTGDYSQEKTRGKWMGFTGFVQGLGAMLTSLVLTKMPNFFQARGADPIEAGAYTLWIGTLICLLAALLVWVGLKPAKTQKPLRREPLLTLLSEGLVAARKDPRVGLAYATAFAARGDQIVVGMFIFLWTTRVAVELGLGVGEGYARGGIIVPIIGGTVMLSAPLMGWLMDRMDRISGVILAFGLSSLGYGLMGLIQNPFSGIALPAAVFLGLGEGAVILVGATLMGKVAPAERRGSVFGTFTMCGAVGLLVGSGLGGVLFDLKYTGPFLMMAFVNFAVFLYAFYVKRRVAEL